MSKPAYDYSEHAHRFAAWAASRAASTKDLRFSVCSGKKWIEAIPDLRRCAGAIDALPYASSFDAEHRKWRNDLIRISDQAKMTHGIAAKIINVYLKASVIHTGHENNPKVKAVHPPVDRLLLTKLTKECAEHWQGQKLSWSKFTSEEYEDVIRSVKLTLGDGVALWEIERYWPGHQSTK